MIADNRIWFGVGGDARPAYKRFLSEVTDSMPATTIWTFDELGHNDEAKKEMRSLFNQNLFGTPKPERLLQRIPHIATHENHLVLDSFLGSGTTAAVAHKMRRRWIGIEMGEQGGISKAVAWGVGRNGEPFRGGGFRFMRLGEAVFDEAGRINPAVRFATLAAVIWQQETGAVFDPLQAKPGTPYLGTHYEFNSCLRSSLLGEEPILFIKANRGSPDDSAAWQSRKRVAYFSENRTKRHRIHTRAQQLRRSSHDQAAWQPDARVQARSDCRHAGRF